MRRAAGLVVFALLVAGVGVTEALTPDPQHVLLVGDSILRSSGPALSRQLGEDWRVHNEAVNGSGLLTPDVFDWAEQLDEQLVRVDPDVVVVGFIGNYTSDPTRFWRTAAGEVIESVDDPAFAPAWGRATDEALTRIAETDARVVLVLPPPLATPQLQAVEDAIRAEYVRLARTWPFVQVVDAAEAVGGPSGEWVATRETVGGDVLPVRTGDTVHLAPHGQRLYARELVPAIRRGERG